VWVLLDRRQRHLRWRVLLAARAGAAPVVLLEKRGKGGRLLHSEQARWCPYSSAGFLHPCEQVAGGAIPRWLIERVESLLRGAPLPRKRREWEQVRGRLIRG
jgi:hypothetical protein